MVISLSQKRSENTKVGCEFIDVIFVTLADDSSVVKDTQGLQEYPHHRK